MRPDPEMIPVLIAAAKALKAGQKRVFMAKTVAAMGYTDAELPTQQTINTKLNMLGYSLTKVAKCRPQKGSRRPTPSSSD